MVAVVPRPVEAAARSHGLGELRRRYWSPSNFVLIFLEWGWALGMGFTALAAAGSSHTAADGTWGIGVPVLGEVLWWAVIAWLGVLGVLTWRNRAMYLFSGGLIITGALGRVQRCAAWSDAWVYWECMGTGWEGWTGYRVIFAGGAAVRFGRPDRYKGRPVRRGLGHDLRAISRAAKLPAALDCFEAGEPLAFGPLTVDYSGVTYKAVTRPWAHIQKAIIVDGLNLYIIAAGHKRIRIRCSRIADLDVLMQVIEHATSRPGTAAAANPQR